tara:strand:+ start:1180 stop:1848 length:669 start_codon:yes stop_codon:yes gene_type:complete
MNMRFAALGLGLLVLSACAPSKSLLERGVAISLNDPSLVSQPVGQFPPRFSALIADTTVPALTLTVESRSQTGRLLLESRINGVETWLSSDLSAVMLENGMLQGTRGVGSELFAAELSEPMALILSGRTGYSNRLHSNFNGNEEIVIHNFRCLVEFEGSAVIKLEIGNAPTRVMTEDCKSSDQSFQNTYWVSTKSGAIVQARQWAGDELGYIKTQAAVRRPA